jgi:uncharacterized membrane protein (DUF106 family)
MHMLACTIQRALYVKGYSAVMSPQLSVREIKLGVEMVFLFGIVTGLFISMLVTLFVSGVAISATRKILAPGKEK